MTDALARLSDAVRMLAEARSLNEITHIHSMAKAAQAYAQAQGLGDEAEAYAREIQLLAARKAGEVLKQMAEAGERAKPGSAGGRGNRSSTVPTIKDLGITADQSARWQRIAAVPDDEFRKRMDRGWGEAAVARGARKKREKGRGDLTPKTKTNGFTLRQSLSGLQSTAVQVQSLAEALDGQLLGDWSRLHHNAEAQESFRILESSLPVLSARIKRGLREWKEQVA